MGPVRRKLPQLQQALHGQIEAHHRVPLQRIFAHMNFLQDSIRHLQIEIDQRLSPFTEAMQLPLSIPGIQAETRAAILAEIGCDMACFPSAKHLARLRGSLSRQQTRVGQASFRQDHKRQCTFASCVDRSGLEHQSIDQATISQLSIIG